MVKEIKINEKVKVGDVFKNYKALCEALNIEPKLNGKGKNLQLKKIENCIGYTRNGHKYIITEIKNTNFSSINSDLRTELKNYSNFLVNKKYENCKGVYKITNGNKIYIGSTTASFRKRFMEHNFKSNSMEYTYNLIHSGGKFEILWIAPNKCDEKRIRKMESLYYDLYKKIGYYSLMNKKDISINNNYDEIIITVPKEDSFKVIKALVNTLYKLKKEEGGGKWQLYWKEK